MQADILMARKEFPGRRIAYCKILVTEPKNAQFLNKVGVAYQQLGDLEQSRALLQESHPRRQELCERHEQLGTIEYEKKHYGKAITYYQESSRVCNLMAHDLQQPGLCLLRE